MDQQFLNVELRKELERNSALLDILASNGVVSLYR